MKLPIITQSIVSIFAVLLHVLLSLSWYGNRCEVTLIYVCLYNGGPVVWKQMWGIIRTLITLHVISSTKIWQIISRYLMFLHSISHLLSFWWLVQYNGSCYIIHTWGTFFLLLLHMSGEFVIVCKLHYFISIIENTCAFLNGKKKSAQGGASMSVTYTLGTSMVVMVFEPTGRFLE